MFNPDFYPTPRHITDKMLDGIDFKLIESVLEPSAGKGDIADRLKEKMRYAHDCYGNQDYNADIDTVEIEPELRHILRGKGLRVVHDDFLTFHTFKHYDLIAMNPPFSAGDKHLLKAIEMQKAGGKIVCLLNAETLRNPCTITRRDLLKKLDDLNASIEYISGAFSAAERKSDVEIALIKIDIPKAEPVSNIFENLRAAQEINQEQEDANQYGAMVDNDVIKGAVQRYNFEVAAGLRLIQEYRAMAPYLLCTLKKDSIYAKPILKLGFEDSGRYSNGLSENEFVRRVRSKYWKALFDNDQFCGLLTSNLRNQYRSKVHELADYDFSLYNIYSIRIEMSQQLVKGVEETIIDLFDELSHKHHWYDETSSNIHYYNGWKTNKAYMINKKVIIPLNGFGRYDGSMDYTYTVLQKLGDIERVFNYLDGGLTEEVDIERALKKAQAHGATKKIPLKYFHVTFYKKGTCHIEFDNLELLKKFNIFGSQRKGWLPPSYGKTKYSDMTPEEQAVVNEFDGGEAEYNKMLLRRDYYIFSGENVLQLAEHSA